MIRLISFCGGGYNNINYHLSIYNSENYNDSNKMLAYYTTISHTYDSIRIVKL